VEDFAEEAFIDKLVEQNAENAQDMQSTGMLNARRATQATVAARTRGLILRRCAIELRMTIKYPTQKEKYGRKRDAQVLSGKNATLMTF